MDLMDKNGRYGLDDMDENGRYEVDEVDPMSWTEIRVDFVHKVHFVHTC